MTAPQTEERGNRDRGDDADARFAAAVAALPLMTPQRLKRVLNGRQAEAVWEEIAGRRPRIVEALAAMPSFAAVPRLWETVPARAMEARRAGGLAPEEVATAWSRRARAFDVERYWRALGTASISVLRLGVAGYPARLARPDEPEPPEVLFARGRVLVAEGPSAAVVGTRRATHYGREVAADIGAELARAGVAVVSGLAVGIDGAAHEGALAVPGLPGRGPVGVLGGGVDVVYPARHRHLIERVAAGGCVISEAPPGAAPEPWRFPLRNRIIAALAQVVVVVESGRQGGAMHTVEAAIGRGREVFAVPGSVRSPASEGTNELLASGAFVARGPEDVLVAIERCCRSDGVDFKPTRCLSSGSGDEVPSPSPGQPERAEIASSLRRCTAVERSVLEALEDQLWPTEAICARTGQPFSTVALALDRLLELGLAVSSEGAWRRA